MHNRLKRMKMLYCQLSTFVTTQPLSFIDDLHVRFMGNNN